MTFGEVLLWYINHLGSRPSAPKYLQIYNQIFAGHPLHERNAETVTRYEIQLLKQQYEKTPAHCRQMLQLVCQSYNYVSLTIDPNTRLPMYAGHNPAIGVRKPPTKSRERLMDRKEIRALLERIEHLSIKYQAFFITRLLAPCRIKELCQMQRKDVDLTSGKWLKRHTKNGRAQYTLIPKQALFYLRQLPIEGAYFFMGNYGKPLARETARKVWVVFREDLRMEDVQLLDFRRTLASYLYTEIKADDLTAKAVLNHYDSRPVAVYVRLNHDQLAKIIQGYADFVWSLRRTPVMPIDRSQQYHVIGGSHEQSNACL